MGVLCFIWQPTFSDIFVCIIAKTFDLFSTPHKQKKKKKSHFYLLKTVQDLGRTWILERNHRKEDCLLDLPVKQLLKSDNKYVSLLCLRIYMKMPRFFKIQVILLSHNITCFSENRCQVKRIIQVFLQFNQKKKCFV